MILLGARLALRDITQAYPQLQTELTRIVLAFVLKELRDKYPPDTLMRVILPLYGVPESGLHWYNTYQPHHLKKLVMTTSTYDPCLMITKGTKEEFGMVGL